ncbi:MAG: hypothetical protein JO025_26995 [Verrucomicrobia bacterium]|nr:hypothetical protein [Verrucomicrobiota bacterium]
MLEEIDPKFLSTESVIWIHHRLVGPERDFDRDRLDSAVHAVESYAGYGSVLDLFDLAGAYAFYISEAQAFLIGNKRTAIAACIEFLQINGVPVQIYSNNELFDWILALANKRVTREEFAAGLRFPWRTD